jgi:ubiquinone/menaquinone biosynthesis C-methylase UbiE
MTDYESPEYWQAVTWDRFAELLRVPVAIRREFIKQEELTIGSLSERLGTNSSLRILDAPGGTGRISRAILERFPTRANLCLVDFNPHTLEQARYYLNDYPNVEFLLLDVHRISSRFREEFDSIVCLDFMHHISQVDNFLSSMSIALKPGGLLVANVLAKERFSEYELCKYGHVKAASRAVSAHIARAMYSLAPQPLKRLIRRSGVGRIKPLSESEFDMALNGHFKVLDFKRSFYHWVIAEKRSAEAGGLGGS